MIGAGPRRANNREHVAGSVRRPRVDRADSQPALHRGADSRETDRLLFDEGGRLVGSVSVSRDISATVAAQQAQAEQERFTNAVLDVAGALVVVLDAHGRVLRFNDACERLSGFKSAEILGRPLWEAVIPPSEVDDVRRVVADLQAGAFPNTHENHWLSYTGAMRLIAWHNTCLTDELGRVTHVIATGIDITDERKGDDALRGVETVGRLLAELGPVPAALDAILAELEGRMGYDFLSLYLRDGDGFRLGAQRGYAGLPECLEPGRGVIGRVFRTGHAELVLDVKNDPDYVAGGPNIVAEIAAPLQGGNETLGVLNIESTEPERLTQADLRLARSVADRLTTELLLAAEQTTLRDRARLFAALAEFAAAVNSILDPERLPSSLVHALATVIPSDTVVITLLDREDGQYRVKAVRGLNVKAVGSVIKPGEGFTGRAIVERTIVMSDDHERAQYASGLRPYMRHKSIHGIAVPLVRENVVLGVISVGRTLSSVTFSDAEREVIALLGSHAALAIANATLVKEVSALAIHDGLTGLFNRRHFDAALDLSIARYKRRAPAGTLVAMMFDLDNFGNFNRLHGHLAGDAMLRLFGGLLHENLRSADLVARYGGEEFVVILEDSSLADAVQKADMIRSELELRPVRGADGEPLHTTVSAGCAEIDPAHPTKESLIGMADACLFQAKRAGRNRVVAA